MNERNLIPEAIEYLSKSDEERILFCKKDHWIGYGAAVKLIEILEDKFLDPPQMRHEGLLIYGDSNNGKTAILKRMYELHKTKLDYVTKDGDQRETQCRLYRPSRAPLPGWPQAHAGAQRLRGAQGPARRQEQGARLPWGQPGGRCAGHRLHL